MHLEDRKDSREVAENWKISRDLFQWIIGSSGTVSLIGSLATNLTTILFGRLDVVRAALTGFRKLAKRSARPIKEDVRRIPDANGRIETGRNCED